MREHQVSKLIERKPLFFSKSTPQHVQEAIKDNIGVQVVHQCERYLGLPTLVGQNKKVSFDNI